MEIMIRPVGNLAGLCLRVIGNFFSLFSILVEDLRMKNGRNGTKPNVNKKATSLFPVTLTSFNQSSSSANASTTTTNNSASTLTPNELKRSKNVINEKRTSKAKQRRPQPPTYMKFSNYLCHGTLIMFGHFNDFFRRIGLLKSVEHVEKNREGYPKMYSSFATFYIRNIIARMRNMWCHPISSVPGGELEILEREFGPYNAEWK